MRTLQEYLADCASQGIIDFRIRALSPTHFYIHPLDKNGDTLDFDVAGNLLATQIDTNCYPAVGAASTKEAREISV